MFAMCSLEGGSFLDWPGRQSKRFCIVITIMFAIFRLSGTRDFIILNKSPTESKKAGSLESACLQNFNTILFPSRARASSAWLNCEAKAAELARVARHAAWAQASDAGRP